MLSNSDAGGISLRSPETISEHASERNVTAIKHRGRYQPSLKLRFDEVESDGLARNSYE